MTQLEKFSLHLPYKVIIKDTKYGGIFNSLDFVTSSNQSFDVFNGNFDQLIKDKILKPYLRSFDQLTKECVQADYNDEPFVPKDELEKLFPNCPNWIYIIGKPHVLEYFCKNGFDKSNIEWSVIRQLLKWHFPIGFEKGEYIEVTNENNPY